MHNRATVEHDGAIRGGEGSVHVLLDQYDRGPGGAEALDAGEDLIDNQRRQPEGRFVEQEERAGWR